MPIINIICPICTDIFENSSDVHSTDCGHLFHLYCFNNWRQRENSCPQCRKVAPGIHKLHLSFDDSVQIPERQDDLQIKVKSSAEKVTELLNQTEELEQNFLKLQEQYSVVDNLKRELMEKVGQMDNAEGNFMRLQAQYTENSETIKQLEDSINQLYIENECKTKELQVRTKENESLRTSCCNAANVTLQPNALYEMENVLKQRIKFVNDELAKEINISSQLSIDNMKLQSYIDKCHSGDNKENIASNEINGNPSCSKNKNVNKSPRQNKNLQNRQEKSSSILIKGLPLNQFTIPLENVVFKLASKMNLAISSEDLIKVYLLRSNSKKSLNANLVAQFKNSEIKDKVLSNKKALLADPDTKFVFIEEFRNER